MNKITLVSAMLVAGVICVPTMASAYNGTSTLAGPAGKMHHGKKMMHHHHSKMMGMRAKPMTEDKPTGKSDTDSKGMMKQDTK